MPLSHIELAPLATLSPPFRFNTHFVDSPWRGEEWKKRHRQHRQQRQRRSSDNENNGNFLALSGLEV